MRLPRNIVLGLLLLLTLTPILCSAFEAANVPDARATVNSGKPAISN